MKIRFNVAGQAENFYIPDMDLDAVPRVGDYVYVPVINRELIVRTVVWFPLGEEPNEFAFVYVVIGNPRPQ